MSCLTLLRRSAWCCRPTWRAPWLSLSSLEFRPLHRHWDSSWPTHTWSVSTRSRIWIGRFLPSQNISYVALDKMYKSLESKYWTVEKQKKTDLCHPSGSSGPRRWNSKPQTPWKIFTKMKESSHLTSHITAQPKPEDKRQKNIIDPVLYSHSPPWWMFWPGWWLVHICQPGGRK